MDRATYYGARHNFRTLQRDARRADAHPYPQDPSQREARAAPTLFIACWSPREQEAIRAWRPLDRYADNGDFPRAYRLLCRQLDARAWKIERGHKPAPIPRHFIELHRSPAP